MRAFVSVLCKLTYFLMLPYKKKTLFKVSFPWWRPQLRPTFFHNSTLPRAASAGVPTLWPSALWTPCACVTMSTPLPRSLTSRILLGSKPLWFVSLTPVSVDVSGTHSPISSVVPCPRSVLVALSLHPGLTLALRKAEFFLPFFFQSAHRKSRCHSSFYHPWCLPHCL